jgi:hypothetical protein
VTAGDAAFRADLVRVRRSGTPSRGDDLLGMAMDVGAHLVRVQSVRVERVVDPESLLVDCAAVRGVSATEAGEAVRRTWPTDLSCTSHGSHHLAVSGDGALLRFVTQLDPGKPSVTGRVAVRVG